MRCPNPPFPPVTSATVPRNSMAVLHALSAELPPTPPPPARGEGEEDKASQEFPPPWRGRVREGGAACAARCSLGKTLTGCHRMNANGGAMTATTTDVPAGGFRYIPGVFQYSGGV